MGEAKCWFDYFQSNLALCSTITRKSRIRDLRDAHNHLSSRDIVPQKNLLMYPSVKSVLALDPAVCIVSVQGYNGVGQCVEVSTRTGHLPDPVKTFVVELSKKYFIECVDRLSRLTTILEVRKLSLKSGQASKRPGRRGRTKSNSR